MTNGRLAVIPVVDDDPVPLHLDNVGVEPGDLGAGGVRSGEQHHPDVEHIVLPGPLHMKFALFQEVVDGPDLVLRDLRQHLQSRVGPVGDDARRSGGCNTPLAAGMGHHHAFHVFDDVGAGLDAHPLRHGPQGLFCQSGAVSHGDGFRAAHGALQFFLQNGDVLPIDFFFHDMSSGEFFFPLYHGFPKIPILSGKSCFFRRFGL